MKLKKIIVLTTLLVCASVIEGTGLIHQMYRVRQKDAENKELLEENIILRSQAARRISEMMNVSCNQSRYEY